MDSKQLLYDIKELRSLFKESSSIETMLDRAVEMVAEYTHSSVCSIYLYNPEDRLLTLRASRGLNPESIGQVRLSLGQGLTGLALQEMQTVCEEDASRNPNYRFFPGIFEERYNAFLAVPITRGLVRMGVLVIQRDSKEAFVASDITALQTVASQLANIIENAQILLGIHDGAPENVTSVASTTVDLKFVKGKVSAPGFAQGPTLVINRQKGLASVLRRQYERRYSEQDFHKAVTCTSDQLEALQERVEDKLSDAASLIFAAHLMILKDRVFIDQVVLRIQAGINPPLAIAESANEFVQGFLASDSAYIQEKANDIEDLALRLINNLTRQGENVDSVHKRIVITRSLFPSDLLKLSSEEAVGIVLVGGGATAHISILARSLGMPMVVSDTYELLDLSNGTVVIVDAEIGNLYIDPDDHIREQFQAQQAAHLNLDEQKKRMQSRSVTKDGEQVRLLANINLLTDLKLADTLQCDGVGLYRTEFPFIVRTTFPSEEEQYVIYRKLVDAMQGKPVTFRTLDAGGDKILSYYHDMQEQNPAMGMRSTRFSLKNRAIFTGQIRAILRAGIDADLRLMFPMISSVDEFSQAREVVYEAIEDLEERGIEHNNQPQLGIMVELPSIVDLMDEFAQEADFFSIGTNDFIQFMLGVDRTNDSVADFYLPHHPSVLRSLNTIVKTATENGREVSLCGDMAHEPQYIPFLLGIGIRSLSVDPAYLLRTQQSILATSLAHAQEQAKTLLAQTRVRDISALLEAVPGASS